MTQQLLNESGIIKTSLNLVSYYIENYFYSLGNDMDGLQLHIIDLDRKVDQLHEIVERLSYQIAALSAEKQSSSNNSLEALPTVSQMRYSSSFGNRRFQSVMEHKDILVEGSKGQSQIHPESEQTLSPEIQIRRLTAQLTAAYNRIAALEEQLLDCRIHS
jgi:hypothetical protein